MIDSENVEEKEFLFISFIRKLIRVVNSGQFSGVAEMVGEVKFNLIFNYWWEELKWSGNFPIKWLYVKDVHHDDVEGIVSGGSSVTKLKDGSMIDYKSGIQLLNAFKDNSFISDIFEAFKFMDEREEKLRYKRDKIYNYIQELKKKGLLPKMTAKTQKSHGKKTGKRKSAFGNKFNKEESGDAYFKNDVEYIKKN